MAAKAMSTEDEVMMPRLPPIIRPLTDEDPYAKSKLMTYSTTRQRQQMLKKIM